MIDTGLQFKEPLSIRINKSIIDPIAIIGATLRGERLWLAATLYDRCDGMQLEPGTPLAEVEIATIQASEAVRFAEVTADGKRAPISGSNCPVLRTETPKIS